MPGDMLWYGGLGCLVFAYSIVFLAFAAGVIGLGFLLLFSIIFWVTGISALTYYGNRLNDSHLENNAIFLHYPDTNNSPAQFAQFVAIANFWESCKAWEVRVGNNGLWHKSARAVFGTDLPKWLKCNIAIHSLRIGNELYCFFPDCVLVYWDKRYHSFYYDDTGLRSCEMEMDDGSEVVGYQWRYARVDGGPDRRYHSNYQIPITRQIIGRHSGLGLRFGTNELFILKAGQ